MSDDEQSLEALESTRRSVFAVKQVVRALESLSRAQRSSVNEVVADASRYLDWIDALVDELAGPPETGPHTRALCVVLGPERSFCGPLAHLVASQLPPTGPLGLVGARLVDLVDESPETSARVRFRLPAPAAVEELTSTAQQLARAILAADHAGPVRLLHPREARSELHAVELLSGPRRLTSHLRMETWSPPESVLEAAVHESVAGRLTVALAESLRSEVQARLLATSSARHACDQRLESLHRSILSERQERTTRELLEIVASHLTGASHRGPRAR